MLAAGDTFRAAADLQLNEWATRSNAVMSKSEAKSPAAVMFDAVDNAIKEVHCTPNPKLNPKLNPPHRRHV
jgi:signal recognition particle GTPase